MRALFLLMVLANVAFFAWARYMAPADASADPAPLSREIDPQKLRVLRGGELPPTRKPAVPESPAPGGPAKDSPPAEAAPAKTTAASLPVADSSPSAVCLEWGSFTIADAPHAEKMLEPLSLGARLGQRHTEETAGWWVFIPPQPNRQGAMRKAAELKSLGIRDYFIVDDSRLRWAVSLGVFRNEDAAKARLAYLRSKGVHSARAGARETVVPKIWLQIKGVDAPLEAKLRQITPLIEGSELRACP
jgi:hypothetical protein